MRSHRKVKGSLFIAASSEAGRSQEAVDAVGDPRVKDEVAPNDATRPAVDEDFPLFRGQSLSAFLLLCILLAFLSIWVHVQHFGQSLAFTNKLTMLSAPPQEKESGEPCRVRAESR